MAPPWARHIHSNGIGDRGPRPPFPCNLPLAQGKPKEIRRDSRQIPEPAACFTGIGAGEGARIELRKKVPGGDLHSRSNKTNGGESGAGMLLVFAESWSRRPGSRPGFSGVEIVEMAKMVQRMLGPPVH